MNITWLYTFRHIPDLNAFIKWAWHNQCCLRIEAATESVVVMTKKSCNARFVGEIPNSHTSVIWCRNKKSTFWIPSNFWDFQLVSFQCPFQFSRKAPYFDQFVGWRWSYEWATLKPGNRKPESGTGNRNSETRNRNPESGIRNPQIKEKQVFKFAKPFLHSFCL